MVNAVGGLHGVAEALGDRAYDRMDLTQPEDELRDCEFLAQTTEALVYVAMIRLMIGRLAKGAM
jgi:hypothetical protein